MHTPHCQQQRRLSSRSLCDSRTHRSQVCVCLCSQQHSFQLGSPSSDSMRICRRRCHQIAQQLGALAAQFSRSLEDQRSHGYSIFRCEVLHAGMARWRLPELLQDTWEPGGHVQDGAARFVVLLHPVVELRVMALHVCVVPCLLDESAQCALDSRSAISQRENTRQQSHSWVSRLSK